MTDLRTIERDSIRRFVQSAADDGYLSGRVLDYGCGKQPYRDIVEAAGGEYEGYDSTGYPATTATENHGEYEDVFWPDEEWDAVLCTQVLQYVPWARHDGESRVLPGLLSWMRLEMLRSGGHLVLTYPTNWPEVEPEDLHRFTKAGMERLLSEAGFEVMRHVGRFQFFAHGSVFIGGYGVIARA